jgi:hypothetical protein
VIARGADWERYPVLPRDALFDTEVVGPEEPASDSAGWATQAIEWLRNV